MADFAAQKAAFNAQFGPHVSPKPANRPNRATRRNSNFKQNFSGPGSLNPVYIGNSPAPANWSATRNRTKNMTSYSEHTTLVAKAAKCQAQMKECMAAKGGSRTRRRQRRRQRKTRRH